MVRVDYRYRLDEIVTMTRDLHHFDACVDPWLSIVCVGVTTTGGVHVFPPDEGTEVWSLYVGRTIGAGYDNEQNPVELPADTTTVEIVTEIAALAYTLVGDPQ